MSKQTVNKIQRLKIGGVKVTAHLVSQAVHLLEEYDRYPNNPDAVRIEEMVETSLRERGLLSLVVFVCPDFNLRALSTDRPEEFVPVQTRRNDLFQPRVRKIKELRQALLEKCGIVATLDVIIGDNSPQVNLIPYLAGISWDWEKYMWQIRALYGSYRLRVCEEFGPMATVWSLADMGILGDDVVPEVSEEDLDAEVSFRLSPNHPYSKFLANRFTASQMRQMAIDKYSLYGRQGKLIAELGGILLQTERPWLRRTLMYRCTGSPGLPAIYPWIRREEVVQLKTQP